MPTDGRFGIGDRRQLQQLSICLSLAHGWISRSVSTFFQSRQKSDQLPVSHGFDHSVFLLLMQVVGFSNSVSDWEMRSDRNSGMSAQDERGSVSDWEMRSSFPNQFVLHVHAYTRGR